MSISKTIAQLEKKGFIHNATVRFDAFVRHSDQAVVAIDDLQDLEQIEFVRTDKEHLTFLYAITFQNNTKGLVIIDLASHLDPISIEMIDALGIPNLSEVQDGDGDEE